MRTNLSQAARSLFDPGTIISFVIGSVTLSVLGNAVTQVLNNWLGADKFPAQVRIIMGAILILFFAIGFFSRSVARQQVQPLEFRQAPPARRRGLILLVSRTETAQKAIEYHQPLLERCWLVCSLKTQGMAQALSEQHPDLVIPDPIIINDVNNPLEFADRISEIYKSLPAGWREDEVIADYTGMTAHGSVGMALACLSPRRPLQYTPAQYDGQLNATLPLDPIEIVLERDGLTSRQMPAPSFRQVK